MTKRIRTNNRNRVKQELKTFFVGDDQDFRMCIAKTAEEAVQQYMEEMCCNADDIDGYRVFEVIGKPKEIKSSNAFALK